MQAIPTRALSKASPWVVCASADLTTRHKSAAAAGTTDPIAMIAAVTAAANRLMSRRGAGTFEREPDACSGNQSVETPLTWNTLQCVCAAVHEFQIGAHDQFFDSARDEHFSWLSIRRDPGAYVDGDSADVVIEHLALAGMQPCANLDAQCSHAFDDRGCAVDAA